MKQTLLLIGLMLGILAKPVWSKEIYIAGFGMHGMVVPLSIEGKVYRFLVGSIFNDHIINKKTALKQGWNRVAFSKEVDISQPKEVLYTPPGKLTLGNRRIRLSETFVTMSDDFFRDTFNNKIDGILGAEFFNQFLWDIDGSAKTFRMLTRDDKSVADFTSGLFFKCSFKGVPSCDFAGRKVDLDIGNASGMDVILPFFWVQNAFNQGLYNLTHVQESSQGIVTAMHGFFPMISFKNGYSIKNFEVTVGPEERMTFSFLARGRTLINTRLGVIQTANQTERKPYVPISLGLDLLKTEAGYRILGKNKGCHLSLQNFRVGDLIYSVGPFYKSTNVAAMKLQETLPTIYHSDDLPLVIHGFRGGKLTSEIVHMAPACIPYIGG